MKQTNKTVGITMFVMFIFGLNRVYAAAIGVTDGHLTPFEIVCSFIFIMLLMFGMCYTFLKAPWVEAVKKDQPQVNAGTGPAIG